MRVGEPCVFDTKRIRVGGEVRTRKKRTKKVRWFEIK